MVPAGAVAIVARALSAGNCHDGRRSEVAGHDVVSGTLVRVSTSAGSCSAVMPRASGPP
ncbi:MAG: hypothetical protein IPK19_41300 [Chloroflexi bacterium]|nr:hypothetical protein [Chloroflexota bacterium]